MPFSPTAAGDGEEYESVDKLKASLATAHAETQRMETFWRISLLDLAQAVDVCKALQKQLREQKESSASGEGSPAKRRSVGYPFPAQVQKGRNDVGIVSSACVER